MFGCGCGQATAADPYAAAGAGGDVGRRTIDHSSPTRSHLLEVDEVQKRQRVGARSARVQSAVQHDAPPVVADQEARAPDLGRGGELGGSAKEKWGVRAKERSDRAGVRA